MPRCSRRRRSWRRRRTMSQRETRTLDPPVHGLRKLQRWFQDQVTGPGDGRLRIYREMYFLRIEDALGADYPSLKRRLGAGRFGTLCRAYIRAHPSTSFTLEEI